jgi:hypothetical protein
MKCMIKYMLLFGLLLLVACTPAVETQTEEDVVADLDPVVETEPIVEEVVPIENTTNEDIEVVPDNTSGEEILTSTIDLSSDPAISIWCVPGQSFTFSRSDGVVDRGYVEGTGSYKGNTFCQAHADRLNSSEINSTYFFSYQGKYMYILTQNQGSVDEVLVEN